MDDTQSLDSSALPHKPLPPLSAAFISADDAAYWAHEQIGSKRDREYGGAILKYENRYFATTPVPGEEWDVSEVQVEPERSELWYAREKDEL